MKTGKLLRVFDNETKTTHKSYWGLVINADGADEVYNLWDRAFADPNGIDVHELVGQQVNFDSDPGKEKPDGSGDCYPGTIKIIQPVDPALLAAMAPAQHSQAPQVQLSSVEKPQNPREEALKALIDGVKKAGQDLMGAADVARKILGS
jgi:hypothetical protein